MPLRDLPRVLRGAALVGREVLRLAESGQILSSQIGWHPRTPAPIIRAAERKPRSGESSAAGSSAAGPTWPSSPVAKPEVAAAAPPPQPSPDAIPPVVAEPAGPPPWPRMTLDGNTEPDELRAPSLPTSAAPDSKPPPDPSEPPAAKAKGSSHRRVPVHPATRALHFGGLGLGLAAGAAAAAVRQTITGEKQANLLMSEANVERLAGTLCRLRGAALKVGQMLSFNDADVLPPPVRKLMERVRNGADYMPLWQLHKTLEEELGADWRKHVETFDETPVAAASIGQVHKATLLDGRTVAIKVQYPGVAQSIVSDLWSMRQLINYTGVVPPGLYLDRVIEVAREELLEECDYLREADNTRRFKRLLAPYPEFAVPAVVNQLSSAHVLTTEWMQGLPMDQAGAPGVLPPAERDRIGERLLWLTLCELFSFRLMQTDPNWSNFLYDPRTRTLSLIDFGACRAYDPAFADGYMRLVRACAEADRPAILRHSRSLGFLTGEEGQAMLDAQANAAIMVGLPFSEGRQPFDFSKQEISRRIGKDVQTMIRERLTPPRKEIYSLHRRLNGCFQLASRVGARIRAREILLDFERRHEFSTEDGEGAETAAAGQRAV